MVSLYNFTKEEFSSKNSTKNAASKLVPGLFLFLIISKKEYKEVCIQILHIWHGFTILYLV